MSELVRPDTRRIRIAAIVALILSLFVAYAVIWGYGDGGWPLLVPAVAAAAALILPIRPVVLTAVIATAAIVVLGVMSVGMFFGPSLAALILALGEFRRAPHKATA